MKIKSIRKVKLDKPAPVYDVLNAKPYHNFRVRTKSGYLVSHNCGLLDEMNFASGASEDMTQSDIMKTYRAVKRRMESRYMKKGELPGILFMVSSKRSEYDFLESYVKSQRDNPNVFIIEDPVWNVKPPETYSGKRFWVAVGNRFIKSKVISDGEDLDGYRKQGYQLIDVPVEYHDAFNTDLESSLMDIANIASSSKSSFIDYERLKKNYTPHRYNPFQSEILTIGLDDTLEIQDFFLPDNIPEEVKSMPGFIHLDMSLRGDKTGISYVVIVGEKAVKKYDADNSNSTDVDLVYRQVFSVDIKSPPNSEISLEKNRTFIYYLKSIGFRIRRISADGFQSADTLQQLTTKGFQTKLISLDRTPNGYLSFRSCINEQRIELLDLSSSLLESELIKLERDSMSGKVDHPPAGCFPADTLILTELGNIKICDLEEGYHRVMAYDEVLDCRIATDFVGLRITKYTDELVHIVTENNNHIECTDNHPILTRLYRYIPAVNLTINSKIVFTDSYGNTKYEKIISISRVKLPKSIPVYDIEVPKYHNFVLANGAVVHNSKDLADSLCGATENAKDFAPALNVRSVPDASLLLESFSDDSENDIEMAMLGVKAAAVMNDFTEMPSGNTSIFDGLDDDFFDDEDGIIF